MQDQSNNRATLRSNLQGEQFFKDLQGRAHIVEGAKAIKAFEFTARLGLPEFACAKDNYANLYFFFNENADKLDFILAQYLDNDKMCKLHDGKGYLIARDLEEKLNDSITRLKMQRISMNFANLRNELLIFLVLQQAFISATLTVSEKHLAALKTCLQDSWRANESLRKYCLVDLLDFVTLQCYVLKKEADYNDKDNVFFSNEYEALRDGLTQAKEGEGNLVPSYVDDQLYNIEYNQEMPTFHIKYFSHSAQKPELELFFNMANLSEDLAGQKRVPTHKFLGTFLTAIHLLKSRETIVDEEKAAPFLSVMLFHLTILNSRAPGFRVKELLHWMQEIFRNGDFKHLSVGGEKVAGMLGEMEREILNSCAIVANTVVINFATKYTLCGCDLSFEFVKDIESRTDNSALEELFAECSLALDETSKSIEGTQRFTEEMDRNMKADEERRRHNREQYEQEMAEMDEEMRRLDAEIERMRVEKAAK